MWKRVRPYVRSLYRIGNGIIGFIYDISRFLRYGGWRGNMNDFEQRNYNVVMVYHGLEKSLSYKNRNPTSGWNNAYTLFGLLRTAKKSSEIGYHDKAGKQILEKFINLPENTNNEKASLIKNQIDSFHFKSDTEHGAMNYSLMDYRKGILENPEHFFNSRYSLREFKDQIVAEEIIERAVKLAMKTPSVCNRQPWSVYHTSDKEVKDIVLSYQAGNKPFGKDIPNLMIVSMDLMAFFSGNEHYQHWIDGGLFSMSLMYAFHSLGVATCALNWSQTPKNDRELRKLVNIKPNHTIIMILAVGYPDENNKVCVSARRPIEEVFVKLEKII